MLFWSAINSKKRAQPNSPLVKIINKTGTYWLQQVPGIDGFHAFETGTQPTQNRRADVPKNRFIVTTANHRKMRVRPWNPSDIIKSVMAKDVLLHAWLHTVNVTDILPMRYISLRLRGSIMYECLPNPRSTVLFVEIVLPRRAI